MTYYHQSPTYQVETGSGFQQFPTKQKAEEVYQNYVNQKVPCEFYLDGRLQMEYKPHI
jgi:hypothetical protein